MSKAKEDYYNIDFSHNDKSNETIISNKYIRELEQQKKEMFSLLYSMYAEHDEEHHMYNMRCLDKIVRKYIDDYIQDSLFK